MRCDEVLIRAAELDGDPVVAAHVRECAACAELLEHARSAAATLRAYEAASPDLAPCDAGAAWRSASADGPRRRAPVRVLRTAGRVAAALLAAVGAFAVLGGRVEASPGRTAIVFAAPWGAPPAETQRAGPDAVSAARIEKLDSDAAARHEALLARIDAVAQRIESAESASDARLSRWVDAVDAARVEDLGRIAADLVSLRRELTAIRWAVSSLGEATASMPPLPDAD